MNLRNLAVAAMVAATATAAQQPFDLDMSFRLPVDEINIKSVLERPDGKLIISGQLRFPGVMAPSIGGGLLNQDGTVAEHASADNPHFTSMGTRLTSWGDRFYTGNNFWVARLFWDGTLDSTWEQSEAIMVQGGDYHLFPDGRVLVTGYGHIFGIPSIPVGPYAGFWLRSDGHIDTTRTPISAEGPIFTIREMPDGKFLCTGGGGIVQGHPSPTIFRLNPDGSLDTTFQAPYLELGMGLDYLSVADGKVLASGWFKFIGSPDTLSLIRLMPDGSLDPTFHGPYCEVTYNTYTFPIIAQTKPLGNDQLIVMGCFDHINGQARGGIAMLDTAGNLLDGYFEGAGCGGYEGPTSYNRVIEGMMDAADGSFYIYGAYHGYEDGTGTDGSNQRLISRLYGLNVGVQEHAANQLHALHIAPNPSNGGAVQLTVASTLRGPQGTSATGHLSIHDASGRVVWQAPWPAGTSTYTMEAGTLAPGTYVVRLAGTQNTISTCKLVILP